MDPFRTGSMRIVQRGLEAGYRDIYTLVGECAIGEKCDVIDMMARERFVDVAYLNGMVLDIIARVLGTDLGWRSDHINAKYH